MFPTVGEDACEGVPPPFPSLPMHRAQAHVQPTAAGCRLHVHTEPTARDRRPARSCAGSEPDRVGCLEDGKVHR